MAVKEDLIKMVLVRLDEILQDVGQESTAYGEDMYRVEELLPESAQYCARVVPSSVLFPESIDLTIDDSSGEAAYNIDERGVVHLPITDNDFLRLVSFKMDDWKTKPTIIDDNDPLYMQQADPVLCGGLWKPIVVLCDGDTRIEAYSTNAEEIKEAKYFADPATKEYANIPKKMMELVAWKTVETILLAIGDGNSSQIATTKFNDILATL